MVVSPAVPLGQPVPLGAPASAASEWAKDRVLSQPLKRSYPNGPCLSGANHCLRSCDPRTARDTPAAMLENLFKLREHGTSVSVELRAGAITFLTMAYIIFVQPTVLSRAGMDFGGVMVATCISAAAATLVMALLANYPVALAPGMGENFFFVAVASGAVTKVAAGWRAALAAVLASGVLFLALGAFRLREAVFEAIPASLQRAIAGLAGGTPGSDDPNRRRGVLLRLFSGAARA